VIEPAIEKKEQVSRFGLVDAFRFTPEDLRFTQPFGNEVVGWYEFNKILRVSVSDES
jgi:hypothetical protein